jgi:translation initiation factor 1A
MPNKKGGKAYKKKGKEDEKEEFIDIQPGQDMARATRILGDRNVMCYCHDDVIRICHICRKMKGRVWVEIGDMVLVSLRDFSTEDPKSIKRGDILAKYPSDQVRMLKKDAKANPRLFLKLEEDAQIRMENLGVDLSGTRIVGSDKLDDGFDFESSEEDESDDEEEDEDKKVAKKDKVSHGRGVRQLRAEHEIAGEEKEINIDDI